MTVISVNFEGVEGGSNFTKIPEGDYAFKITKVVQKTGENSGKPYLLFTLKATSGPAAGVNESILHTCSLTKNALWNLRNLLEAAGKTIPAKAIKIDLDKLTGLTLAGSVVDDEYGGKKKSVIAAFFPLSELATSAVKKDDEEDASDPLSGSEEGEEESTEEEEELFG